MRIVADFLENPPESPSATDLSLLREMALMIVPHAEAGARAAKGQKALRPEILQVDYGVRHFGRASIALRNLTVSDLSCRQPLGGGVRFREARSQRRHPYLVATCVKSCALLRDAPAALRAQGMEFDMEEDTGAAAGKKRRVTFRMEGGDYDAPCERCEHTGQQVRVLRYYVHIPLSTEGNAGNEHRRLVNRSALWSM